MLYEGVYKIAEHVFILKTHHQYTHIFCSKYKSTDTPSFEISVDKNDINYEREKAIKEARYEGKPFCDYEDSYLESLAVLRKFSIILLKNDFLLFHGSTISLDGEAYIFTAKSGTGKSTHTAFWQKVFGKRCIMINDDKPILKIVDDSVIAFGSPWCGKHNLGNNVSYPVRAISVLHRAQKNKVIKADRKDVFGLLLQQTHRPIGAENMAKLLHLVDKMSQQVELFNVYCNLDESSATEIYNGMKG